MKVKVLVGLSEGQELWITKDVTPQELYNLIDCGKDIKMCHCKNEETWTI